MPADNHSANLYRLDRMNINGVNITQAAPVDLSKLKTPQGIVAATQPEEVNNLATDGPVSKENFLPEGTTLSRFIQKDLVNPFTGEVTKHQNEYGHKNWGLASERAKVRFSIETNLELKFLKAIDSFSNVVGELAKSNPELLDKHWGFSIDEDNNAKINDSLNKLSIKDKALLQKELDKHDDVFSDFAEALAIKQGFGREYSGPQNAYNLTRENMTQVTDFRELLAKDTKGSTWERVDTQLARQGVVAH